MAADDPHGPWHDYADPAPATSSGSPRAAAAPKLDPQDGPWRYYADPAPATSSGSVKANDFDQFDATPTRSGGVSAANDFDQFDPPSRASGTTAAHDFQFPSEIEAANAQAPKPTALSTAGDVAGDVAKGTGRGILEGLTADAATAPHDLAVATGRGMDWIARKALGLPNPKEDQSTAFDRLGETVHQGFDKFVPAAPDTTAGRYAESIGRAVPGAAAMPGSIAKNIALQAVLPGAGSEALGHAAKGTDYEGAAHLAGGLLGAGTGFAAEYAARATGVRSLTKAGRAQLAGERLVHNAADPAAARATLDATPSITLPDGSVTTGQTVPGSQPTTAQLTGDMGLLGREKTLETQDSRLFNDRRTAQNNARVAALPQSDGDAESLSSGLRNVLADLDEREGGRLADARNAAQDAASGLGGRQSADFYGRQAQAAVQPDIDAARQGVSGIMDRLGGTDTPEVAGAQGRSVAQASMDAAKTQRRALYDAIDPDGSLHMVASPVREGADTVAKGISQLAAQPAGEEGAILAQMRGLPDVASFRDMQALDSRITAARTAEYRANGESPAYARLGLLKGHVLGAITDGVANQIAYERHGIATGQMAGDVGMETRMRALFQPDLERFYAGRAAGDAEGALTGTGGGGGSRSVASPGAPRGGGQGAGRSSDSSGSEGVSAPPLQPNFDEAVADRLAAAKAAHATYAQTFKQGPVAGMLRTNGFASQYKLVDGGVPSTVFKPGPTGGDAMRAYLAATGDAGASVARNFAAMSLRRAAMTDGQTLNPARYRTWLGQHDAALRALPNNGRAEFAALGPAQDALDRFAPFTGATAPSAIPEMFFHSGPGGADAVNNLRSHIGDRAATSILTDYAASRLRQHALNPDGTLDPRRVASFVKAHDPALSALPGLKERFQSAAQASETINAVAAQRKAALDAFQREAVGTILGSTDAADITRMVGNTFAKQNGVKQFKDLAAKAAQAGPDAVEGLRKAVVDHVMNTYVSNREAGTSGVNKVKGDAFQTFVKQKSPMLHQVFSPAEVGNMKAISDDMARANRSIDASHVPGQSQTAALQHKVAAAGGHGGGDSLLQRWYFLTHGVHELAHQFEKLPLLGEFLGPAVGHLGLPIFAGKKMLDSIKARGMTKVDDLEREAMLNPHIARDLLRKVTPHNAESLLDRIGGHLLKLAPFYSAMGDQHRQQAAPARAAGGRVEPTEAQKEAGNYRKDHARFAGLDITIENRKGSIRSGTSADGKSWSTTTPADYGFIRGTLGADGDHVDCYVGPDENAPYVWIINQMRLHPRRFDEHKVMLGFRSRDAALETYIAGFSDGTGKKRIGSLRAVPIKVFPAWVKSEATKKAA